MKDFSVVKMLEEYIINESMLRLKGYNNKENKELEELSEKKKELDYCISCLPNEEKEIITQLYINKISIRQLSKLGIMSRTSVVRKRDKALKLLENMVKTLNS